MTTMAVALFQTGNEKRARCKTVFWVIGMALLTWMAAAEVILGHYGITSVEYRDTVNYGAHRSPYLIRSYRLIGGAGETPFVLLECFRKCVTTPGCVSFEHEPLTGECHLSRYDKCIVKRNYVYRTEGIHTYELKSPQTHEKTCLRQCIDELGCHACGRYFCSGHDCEFCRKTCWTLVANDTEAYEVYETLENVVTIHCDNHWQKIWSNNANFWFTFLEEFSLKLRLEVKYVDEEENPQYSYFESVSYDGSRLTVGNYTGGEAGNSWKAPFMNRRKTNPSRSTCSRFFYDPQPTCYANGIPSVQEQIKMGAIYPWIKTSYYWESFNANYTNKEVKEITLWVTEKDD